VRNSISGVQLLLQKRGRNNQAALQANAGCYSYALLLPCRLQVLWGNRNVAFVVVLPLALAAEGTNWSWVAALRLPDWGALLFIGAL
jgi:hypothetical protein